MTLAGNNTKQILSSTVNLDLFSNSLWKLCGRITEYSEYSFLKMVLSCEWAYSPGFDCTKVNYFFVYIWFLNLFSSAFCHGCRNLVSPKNITYWIPRRQQSAALTVSTQPAFAGDNQVSSSLQGSSFGVRMEWDSLKSLMPSSLSQKDEVIYVSVYGRWGTRLVLCLPAFRSRKIRERGKAITNGS